MSRQPNELKKRSGAELRAQAAQRAAAAADPAEQARRVLANHEHVIESARRSFVDMGRSLLAIRTERLYAGEYSTFGEYLDARWDISEAYANRVITAALVAIKATPIGVEINSEAQARELADLADEPEQLRQVWDEATRRAAGGRVTAALIKEVRKAIDPPEAGALDGEVVDPLDKFPDAKDAIETSMANRSTPADRDPESSPEVPAVATAGQLKEDHPGSADLGEVEDRESSAVGGAPTPADAQPLVDTPLEDSVDGEATGPEDAASQQPSAPVELPQEQQTTGVSVSAPAGDPEHSGGSEERGQAAASVPASPQELGEEQDHEQDGEQDRTAAPPIPSWLAAITAVCAAVHELDEQDPLVAAEAVDDDLAAELGSAVLMVTAWYRQMQEAK